MLLGKELINVFKPDVMILFDCGAGEMMKAALSQRVLCVGIVPNKTHKEMLMVILRKFLEGMNLVNLVDGCPSKPLTMIQFEADHPDNEDVKRSVGATTASSLIQVDPASPKAIPSTPIAKIANSPQTPKTLTPKASPSPAPKGSPLATSPVIIPAKTGSASSTQTPPPPVNKSVLSFGTTVL